MPLNLTDDIGIFEEEIPKLNLIDDVGIYKKEKPEINKLGLTDDVGIFDENLMIPQEKSASWLKEMGKDVLKSTKRLAGITIGAFNSPLAFVWGSQAEQYRYPEQWKKLPEWKKAVVSTGAGFESAYRHSGKS